MKKKQLLFVLALSITVLFSSCMNLMVAAMTTPKTFKINLNEYNPFEKNVTISYSGALLLKLWNGSDVIKTMYEENSIYLNDNIILTMPSGNNSLIFDVYITQDGAFTDTSYRIPNVELQYLMEDGKKYEIKTKIKKREFLMEFYDTTKRSELLKVWKIGDKK